MVLEIRCPELPHQRSALQPRAEGGGCKTASRLMGSNLAGWHMSRTAAASARRAAPRAPAGAREVNVTAGVGYGARGSQPRCALGGDVETCGVHGCAS